MSYKYRKGGTPSHQPNIAPADNTRVAKASGRPIGNFKAQQDSGKKELASSEDDTKRAYNQRDPAYKDVLFRNADASYARGMKKLTEGNKEMDRASTALRTARLSNEDHSDDIDPEAMASASKPKKKK